jgi:hypothetical protein
VSENRFPLALVCIAELKSTSDKRPNHGGHRISGIKDENGRGDSSLEKAMNDSHSLPQIEARS